MRLRLTSAAVLATLAACAPAQPPRALPGPATAIPTAVPERITAPTVPTLEGFPQAVRVGFTVHVAGMVPVDSAGRLVGGGDLAAQTRQALANLAAVVRAARGVPGDVVRITVYLRDASAANVALVRTAVLDALDRATPPALTVVGVTGLPEAGMLVMVDGTAQLRSEFPDRTRMRVGSR